MLHRVALTPATVLMADDGKARVALVVDGEKPFMLPTGGEGAPGVLLGRGGRRYKPSKGVSLVADSVSFESPTCKSARVWAVAAVHVDCTAEQH